MADITTLADVHDEDLHDEDLPTMQERILRVLNDHVHAPGGNGLGDATVNAAVNELCCIDSWEYERDAKQIALDAICGVIDVLGQISSTIATLDEDDTFDEEDDEDDVFGDEDDDLGWPEAGGLL